jgi:hypothetical protein
MAMENLPNLQTLRLIHPHDNLARVLLTSFLDKDRHCSVHSQRLWLENCKLIIDLSPEKVDGSKLKSIRLRRLRLDTRFVETPWEIPFALTRGGSKKILLNGRGDIYSTFATMPLIGHDHRTVLPSRQYPHPRDVAAAFYDDDMYQKLGREADDFLESNSDLVDKLSSRFNAHHHSNDLWKQCIGFIHLLEMNQCHKMLTSLNLDWLMLPVDIREDAADENKWPCFLLHTLSAMHFPNLTSFQLRNAVSTYTKLPSGLFLFSDSTLPSHEVGHKVSIDFLGFLESHDKLEYLAWPMDRWFPTTNLNDRRIEAVVGRLSTKLKTLRIDSYFDPSGEPQTERNATSVRARRRLFIEKFASQMHSIETLKIEGGVPRDEKREVLRALRRCPLKKIVLIGVTFPLGNTWGEGGRDVSTMQESRDFDSALQAESDEVVMGYTKQDLQPLPDHAFSPTYGWPPGPPILYYVAALFASTVTELKFCGYHGSIVLNRPGGFTQGITPGVLHHLRYFHKLETLILSFYLIIKDHSDTEIIQNWVTERENRENADRAALTPGETYDDVSMAVDEANRSMDDQSTVSDGSEEEATHRERIKAEYGGAVLAMRVFDIMREYLSPTALRRQGGVNIRASFCLGDITGDIFDLDVWMNDKQVIRWIGPREEATPERAKTKLDSREYF